MKNNKLDLFLYIVTLLSFVLAVWFSVGNYYLKAENSILKATPVATCPTPIVTAEQLEQAGYNLDKLVQHSFKQE